MATLFTALNVEQYKYLISTKTFPLVKIKGNKKGLNFTEDKFYWVEKLKNQEEKENILDYSYSILISFEIFAEKLNGLFEKYGRYSEKIAEYHSTIQKPLNKPILLEHESDILCIEDVYESKETKDGVSQQWSIIAASENSELWINFKEITHKIVLIGAIPGAVELAKNEH